MRRGGWDRGATTVRLTQAVITVTAHTPRLDRPREALLADLSLRMTDPGPHP
ncbi:hypothetical protein [Streptomyces sp. MA5143a]|uniref:hypothetical protein n=1 Tax=Streptomyces sp. MA5143a TaxID=2083010 RepID=UPI0015E6F8CD|nr:hypothetical protein [Streptomyces sp. MA5143a]